jgi:hypothetical protein
MSDTTPVIKLNPGRILVFLLICIALLVGLSIRGQYVRFFPNSVDVNGAWGEFSLDLLMHAFNMDSEADVPTFFNTVVLFVAAILFAAIAVTKFQGRDKFRIHWAGLGILFLYLSIDEAAVLHERLIKPMRSMTDLGGIFYFAWIVPGIAFVVIVGLMYLRFFLNLETKFKILFLASVLLYFGGVIGGEMLSGYFAESIGQKNFTYAVVSNLEEAIELIGASMLIYTLLAYIKQYLPEGITIRA